MTERGTARLSNNQASMVPSHSLCVAFVELELLQIYLYALMLIIIHILKHTFKHPTPPQVPTFERNGKLYRDVETFKLFGSIPFGLGSFCDPKGNN
jgi:hypothetical protein